MNRAPTDLDPGALAPVSTSPSEPGQRHRLSRRGMLVGLTGGAALLGTGALAYRAWDQGVFQVGEGPAYDPWRDWRRGPGFTPLIRAATLAPSPHNAQAWLFGVGESHIDVHVDRTRRTGAVDPFGREMYVGIGTAIENLALSAAAHGFQPHITTMPGGPGGSHAASVRLAPGLRRPGALHDAIPRRHTDRYPYAAGRDIPLAALAAMSALGSSSNGEPVTDDLGNDVSLHWFTSREDRGLIGELLVSATEAFIDDPDQIGTDYQWFRQDWDEIQRHRDGITIDAAGLPDLKGVLAKVLPAQSGSATAESWLSAVRDRHTATAAAYGVLAARDVSDDSQRVTGGRLLERVHLWCTANGLSLHHMNQITERADRERQLGLEATFDGALDRMLPDGWQPLCAFRLGFPTHDPRLSPRRAIADVITT